ncbi:MAG: amidohydrolase, partial [Bacteroidetes bacterium]|nr:amidohydrolase [Bacteroidota bacterium]
YPGLVNDIDATNAAKTSARQYMGDAQVVDMPIRMGSEDFAYYTHHVPACFYRLGTGNDAKGTTKGLHTPSFDIDEVVLRQSTGLLAWLAVNA